MFGIVKWIVTHICRRIPHICIRPLAFISSGILVGLLISSRITKHIEANFPVDEIAPKAVSFLLEPGSVCSSKYEIDWSELYELQTRVKVLCYVNTIPMTYKTKARHVMNTWARHCTKHLFISSEESTELPVINMNMSHPESRAHLWSKMQKAMRYLYQFRDQYDFFYKVDDDTFATVENLQYALKDLNPDEPIISGFPFTHVIDKGHLSGGAGYVLSRATLKLLVEKALGKHPECPTYDEDLEDVKLSLCAYAIGARYVPILDRHTTIPYVLDYPYVNEQRFQWMDLLTFFEYEQIKKRPTSIPQFDPQNPFVRDEHNLLSELLISLHYIPARMHYVYHFISHYLRPVGIVRE
ncbi:Glycoprotein-N-acetylgalactosamine 3-beta-galactosyltransferase 1 [Fasciola hepatica]|uniref:N-acetylgalactosaminide beta-1,3-galactosyltransferase n=1 Tax=Fasciola hepatica TaxID=6192 RepID=A0A4E0RL68_FASHE|nr:Glycoprotein-N-acetylgalactosamine 3-beta-galactosyltransferase 1 [Fasciola hepatica]